MCLERERRRLSSPLASPGEGGEGKSAFAFPDVRSFVAAVSELRLIYMPETLPISSLHLPASSSSRVCAPQTISLPAVDLFCLCTRNPKVTRLHCNNY